jgi:hypothetical protein
MVTRVTFVTSLWRAPDLASSPARRFTPAGRWAAAATLVLGAGFQVAAFATEPPHSETIDRLRWIAENENRANLAKTFDFLAMPFLLGVVIVYVLLSRERSPKLAYAGRDPARLRDAGPDRGARARDPRVQARAGRSLRPHGARGRGRQRVAAADRGVPVLYRGQCSGS